MLLRRADIAGDRASLWRYQKALVHQGPVPISLGEGWTPLVHGDWRGRAVQWKCEFVSISGSFKDRGVAVMINHLLANGVTRDRRGFVGKRWRGSRDLCGGGEVAVPHLCSRATSPGKITADRPPPARR